MHYPTKNDTYICRRYLPRIIYIYICRRYLMYMFISFYWVLYFCITGEHEPNLAIPYVIKWRAIHCDYEFIMLGRRCECLWSCVSMNHTICPEKGQAKKYPWRMGNLAGLGRLLWLGQAYRTPFQYQDSLSRYGDFHIIGCITVLSYNGNSYNCKTKSLFWTKPW